MFFFYVIVLLVIVIHTGLIRASLYPVGIYGSQIEGNKYYFRTDKNKQEYAEVTREKYEAVDKADTNLEKVLFSGLIGLVFLHFFGVKSGLLQDEDSKNMWKW